MLVSIEYSVVGSYATILIVDVVNSGSNPIDWNINFPKNIKVAILLQYNENSRYKKLFKLK